MNKNLYSLPLATILAIGTMSAQTENPSDLILLDLSQSTTKLTFDSENGMWEGTYDDDETEIESQVFSIVHGSMSDWDTWYGFTASNSTDNKYQANSIKFQFSNMAQGGIALNEDGSIKLNEFGAPVTSKDMPYLVGFPMSGFPPAEIAFNTEKSYEVVGAYVNLNTYTFYSLIYGNAPARAFTQGDDLKLIVKGIDADENEKAVEITLASFNNGNLTASTGWTYVDLSELGVVEELKFNMSGTDSGNWGLNTPSYFCLDKLAVKEVTHSSAISPDSMRNTTKISYDRNSHTINLNNKGFVAIYDSLGHIVMTATDIESISVASLAAGIYVVKSGNNRLKFAR